MFTDFFFIFYFFYIYREPRGLPKLEFWLTVQRQGNKVFHSHLSGNKRVWNVSHANHNLSTDFKGATQREEVALSIKQHLVSMVQFSNGPGIVFSSVPQGALQINPNKWMVQTPGIITNNKTQ